MTPAQIRKHLHFCQDILCTASFRINMLDDKEAEEHDVPSDFIAYVERLIQKDLARFDDDQ